MVRLVVLLPYCLVPLLFRPTDSLPRLSTLLLKTHISSFARQQQSRQQERKGHAGQPKPAARRVFCFHGRKRPYKHNELFPFSLRCKRHLFRFSSSPFCFSRPA